MVCLCVEQKQELSDIQESIRSNQHDGLKVTGSIGVVVE